MIQVTAAAAAAAEAGIKRVQKRCESGLMTLKKATVKGSRIFLPLTAARALLTSSTSTPRL